MGSMSFLNVSVKLSISTSKVSSSAPQNSNTTSTLIRFSLASFILDFLIVIKRKKWATEVAHPKPMVSLKGGEKRYPHGFVQGYCNGHPRPYHPNFIFLFTSILFEGCILKNSFASFNSLLSLNT